MVKAHQPLLPANHDSDVPFLTCLDSDSEPEDPNVKRPARRKKQGGRDDSDYEGTPPVKPVCTALQEARSRESYTNWSDLEADRWP